jgi:hypothetical protein
MMPKSLPTYVAEAAVAGANNKVMLAMLNPAASGKLVKLWSFWYLVPASSGATVIIPYELRRISALSAGTAVTPGKFDSADEDSSATIKSNAPTVTDVKLVLTRIHQISAAHKSQGYEIPLQMGSEAKPLLLREGEGVCLKQIANNTSTFRVGILYTEEDK